jgi:hypothetical protein
MAELEDWKSMLASNASGFPMTRREAEELNSLRPQPENPDIRTNGFVYPEEQAAVDAAKRVLLEEMQRAGIYGTAFNGEDIDSMARSIAIGQPNEAAQDAMAIMRIGRGMDLDEASLGPMINTADGQGMPSPESFGQGEYTIAGVPLQQIWENQRQGWDGYGWTDQKIKALGRNPEARELSPGGQAAWNWRNNELLLRGLLEQGHNPMQPGAPSTQDRLSSLQSSRENYEQNRDRTHGESGYLGATQNQEYLAGKGMSLLDAIPQAAWAGGFSSDPLSALAEAGDQRDIRKYGFAVEPILPAGLSAAEGTKDLRRALLADAPAYDLWYRAQGPGKKDQSWPTYAGSTAATFANGFLDPTFFATGPARGIVQRLGLGLLRAGRNPSVYGKMAGNMMRGYGARLAKDAADATFWPVVRPGLSEAADEVPTNAGLSAFFYGTSGNTAGPPQPGPSNWFSSKGRTDKYVQDKETGQWREPTQQEVEDQYAEAMAKYQAGRRSRPAVVEQIKKSLLP